MWSEHTTPQGRKFYFNSTTRSSQWNKPATSIWTTYHTPEGRPYYHNSHTGETTWNAPAPLLDTVPEPSASKFQPHWPDNRLEAAFMQLLADNQVDHSWEWDRVLRATVSHPAYRSIEGVQRKKALWLKYLHLRKQWEREQRDAPDRSPIEKFFGSGLVSWNCRFLEAQDAFLRWLKDQNGGRDCVLLKSEFALGWLEYSRLGLSQASSDAALEEFKSFLAASITNECVLQVKWREFYFKYNESAVFVNCLRAGYNPMTLFKEHLKQRRLELAAEDREFAGKLRHYQELCVKRHKLKERIRSIFEGSRDSGALSWDLVKDQFTADQLQEAKEIFEKILSSQVEEGELLSEDEAPAAKRRLEK